ncbi:MAG: PEP/pyruvate-binding domain-containing protein [Patescibacteria group bacterium]
MKKKYIRMWGDENISYSELTGVLLNYGQRLSDEYGIGITEGAVMGTPTYTEYFITEDQIKKNAEMTYQLLKNRNNLKKVLKGVERAMQELHDMTKVVAETDMIKLSAEELWELGDLFGLKVANTFIYYALMEPERYTVFETELIKFLKEKRVTDIPKTMQTLTEGEQQFKYSKKAHAFLGSSLPELIRPENAKLDATLIEQEPYRLKKISQRKRKALLKKLQPPKKIEHVIDILRQIGFKRLEMRFIWMLALYYNELFFIEIKRRYKIQKKEARLYNERELRELFLQGKKIPASIIKRRQKGMLCIFDNAKIRCHEGGRALQQFKNTHVIQKSSEELKGTVAAPGRAVGKAVLLSYRTPERHAKLIEKMSKGDIIITEMTRPNIVIACKKAAAIVTDEGGMTSHAAIISREFKVPCIIGTERATEVIKNGQYLEVDAHKGVVRIISKEEYNQKRKKPIFRRAKVKELSRKKQTGEKTTRTELVVPFSAISKNDIGLVGGKGANLGELARFAPVPDGFCITIHAYKDFLDGHGLTKIIFKKLGRLNIENATKLKRVSREIRRMITSEKTPDKINQLIIEQYQNFEKYFLAVRSSATAEDLPTTSFAGQQATYLNVKGEKSVITAIKQCWASLFTPEAIYYREANNFDHSLVFMAVVVQRMVNADSAGVMFTANPATGNLKEIVIEGSFGLGEAVVSGSVTPDNYRLNKDSLKIGQININEKKIAVIKDENGKTKTINLPKTKQRRRVLSAAQLKELGMVGKKIEKHFKSPQDIEWAYEGGKLFITQARDITTL